MIDNKKVLAVIPARGGSKGLPDKNVKMLCGKPLIGWPIAAAQRSKYVDRIIVSTDDQRIASMAAQQGAEIPFLRPQNLATDEAATPPVISHAIQALEEEGDTFDYVVLLEATSPLTESADIDSAIERLHRDENGATAIVGVAEVESAHPDFCLQINSYNFISPLKPANFPNPPRRQDIEKLYRLEGSLYISTIASFKKHLSFYHANTLGYVVDNWKAFEVDSLVDFICIEAIMKNLEQIKNS